MNKNIPKSKHYGKSGSDKKKIITAKYAVAVINTQYFSQIAIWWMNINKD